MSPPGEMQHGRGFSLFEILVVLVLLGLASAVILPSFSGGFMSLELEAESRDLVTRMKQARSAAISEQQVFRIALRSDPEGGSTYVLTNAYEEELESWQLPSGMVFAGQEPDFKLWVSFYPNGRSSGAEFQMKNERGKTLGIRVDPITGFARVLKPQKDANLQ